MDATEVTEVCRLCPSSGGGQGLLNVFDKTISFKYNIREVVLMNTGIEILENDLVSKKICQRCCNILYKMYEFRLDALKQDRKLKDKCGQYLGDKGIRLPNTCITIKKEKLYSSLTKRTIKTEPDRVPPPPTPSKSKEDFYKLILHPSVADVFKTYPHFKLPKKCFESHIAPVVSLTMGEVETYFKKQKLDIRKFIYKPRTKTHQPQEIAKKKTSLPTKQKTVAPLKISKKLLENHAKQGKSTNDYISLSVSKNEKIRKRKISSDSDRSAKVKSSRNDQPNSLPVPKISVEPSKSAITKPSVIKTLPSVSNLENVIPETSGLVKTPSPIPAVNSRSPSPAPADPMSDDSRDSLSTNISEVPTSSSSIKPRFMESFGLTPTVTTTKSHTLLVCSLCGSVHHNAYELKRHLGKHMVCQFCKLKFKSVEAKQDHVDHECKIKEVMNSPGPIIKLEKVHLNLDIRKKYRNAFDSFELIPGLVEPTPVEQVILRAASPPPPDSGDAVIVLSDDDDETSARSLDPLSGIPTPSANMPPPAVENVIYSTVSIVRPDIRIKNNMILNTLVENMADKEILKELILLLKPQETTVVESMVQTDLPASRDIKINNAEGTCEFKSLKGQLATYKIPITISNGPFHVGYQFRDTSNTNKCLELWDELPVVDICKKTAAQLPNENTSSFKNAPASTYASKSSLAETPQVQSLDVAASSVIINTNVTTNSTIMLSRSNVPTVSTGSSDLVNVPNGLLHIPFDVGNLNTPIVNNTNIIPNNTSNSATPLLQNYALSMATVPLISNPIPIPRTYINSALSNTASTLNRTMLSTISNSSISRPLSSVTGSYNRSLSTSKPDNISLVNTPSPPSTSSFSSVLNKAPTEPANSYLTNMPLSATTTAAAPTAAAPIENSSAFTLGKSSISTPVVSEIAKFRVKNVWELQ